MEECIRCGTCHSVCPQEAVRHDGEKIPEDIKINIELTKKCMENCAKYLGDVKEKDKCLERMLFEPCYNRTALNGNDLL